MDVNEILTSLRGLLEVVYMCSYEELLTYVREDDACDEVDLLAFAQRLQRDMVWLARGDIEAIRMPPGEMNGVTVPRFPRRGQFRLYLPT